MRKHISSGYIDRDYQPQAAQQCHAAPDAGLIEELLNRLTKIEASMEQLVEQRMVKDWYSTDEVAAIVRRAPFTVREWCRNGRINATKRECGRGSSKEWIVSHDELRRIQNEGLLPEPMPYRHRS